MRIRIHELVRNKDLAGLNDLLARFPSMIHSRDERGRLPIHYPVSKAIVETLLNSGATPNVKDNYGNTPLFSCAEPRIAEVLIAYGADINAKRQDGWTPLFMAIYTRNTRLAKYLIRKGALLSNRCSYGYNALHLACMEGKLDLIKFLLTYPEIRRRINARNIDGITPLHAACMEGQTKVARLLLREGAKPVDFAANTELLLKKLMVANQSKKRKRKH